MQKKQFYHHCFECTDVQEGDAIPVGAGRIGSVDMPWKVRVDFETFYPKFAETIERNRKQFESPAWQNWLKDALPDIDPKLTSARLYQKSLILIMLYAWKLHYLPRNFCL